jgi:hypothetical protein
MHIRSLYLKYYFLGNDYALDSTKKMHNIKQDERISNDLTFDEFAIRFNTEKQCRGHLFMLRRSDGFVCPDCNGNEFKILRDPLLWHPQYKHQASGADAIFQGARAPLRTWFIATWRIAERD